MNREGKNSDGKQFRKHQKKPYTPMTRRKRRQRTPQRLTRYR